MHIEIENGELTCCNTVCLCACVVEKSNSIHSNRNHTNTNVNVLLREKNTFNAKGHMP